MLWSEVSQLNLLEGRNAFIGIGFWFVSEILIVKILIYKLWFLLQEWMKLGWQSVLFVLLAPAILCSTLYYTKGCRLSAFCTRQMPCFLCIILLSGICQIPTLFCNAVVQHHFDGWKHIIPSFCWEIVSSILWWTLRTIWKSGWMPWIYALKLFCFNLMQRKRTPTSGPWWLPREDNCSGGVIFSFCKQLSFWRY